MISDSMITARNTETGDEILLMRDAIFGRWIYQINKGPMVRIPEHINAMGLKTSSDMALKLLREHIAQCQASETEELTLP